MLLAFAATLAIQIFLFPLIAQEIAREYPEVVELQLPLFYWLGIVIVVCSQIVLVLLWHLLTQVAQNRVFTSKSLLPVNLIIGSFLAAFALAVTFIAFAQYFETLPPSALLALTSVAFGSLGAALLMVVMRGLLQHAITSETELAEVI